MQGGLAGSDALEARQPLLGSSALGGVQQQPSTPSAAPGLRGAVGGAFVALRQLVPGAARPRQAQHGCSGGADCAALFLPRLVRLLRICRAHPVLLLVVLSVLEAYVISLVGGIASAFYQIFLDQQAGRLGAIAVRAACLYAASAALSSSRAALAEYLAYAWRGRLASHMQALYAGAAAEPVLQRLENPDQRLTSDLGQLTAAAAALFNTLAAAPLSVAYYSWCTYTVFGSLWPVLAAVGFFAAGALLQRALALPVARLVFGQEAVEGGYRFAVLRLRTWAAEVAMYRGEAVELKHLHGELAGLLDVQRRLVWRRWALAASTKGIDYAGALLNYGCLVAAVFGGSWAAAAASSPGDLAARVSLASFYLLTLIYSFTQVLDLAKTVSDLMGLTARVGQLLEALEGAAGGGATPAAPPTAGLQPALCRSGEGQPLTPLRAGALSVGRLAAQCQLLQPPTALAAPMGDLIEVSVHSVGADLLAQQVAVVFPEAPQRAPLLAAVTFQFMASDEGGTEDAATGGSSDPAVQGASPRRQPPAAAERAHRSSFESVASADSAASGLSIARHEDGVVCPDMDRLLGVFLTWQARVREQLQSRGYWCDAIDPRTGYALHGPAARPYNEVIGAEVLLGYASTHHHQQAAWQHQGAEDGGSVGSGSEPHGLVSHPAAGTQVYPATLFTSAPLGVLQAALRTGAAPAAAAALSTAGGPKGAQCTLPQAKAAAWPAAVPAAAAAAPVLQLRSLTMHTPGGACVVERLSLQVLQHGSLLITGRNGAGKSTLLRCLAGLLPAASGVVSMPPPSRVMFLPQRPMLAPGSSLRQQLAYPGPLCSCGAADEQLPEEQHAPHCACSDACCRQLLAAVGLQQLPGDLGCGLDGPLDWAAVASPGELQRLAIARVLHASPALAFLDESTSSVPADAEAQLYAALRSAGITCVSVGHSDSLRALHQRTLRILGDGCGGWRLGPSGEL